ncbi:MAG: MarR family winged helix-turn-helix transcriptional regulator, partial [Acidimicrobiales bacterium]
MPMVGSLHYMAQAARRPTAPAETAVPDLDDDLHWLMARVARGLGMAEDDVVRRHGLSLRGYVVLLEIAKGHVQSQLAIARSAAVDKSVLVGVLDELEAVGFVTRRPDPTDRRVRIVEATEVGLSALCAASA